MKFNGQSLQPPAVEYVVLPRGDAGQDIVFHVTAVTSFDHFDKLCPRPRPKRKTFADGHVEFEVDAEKYLKEVDEYSKRRVGWMYYQSICTSPNITFDTIKPDDPSTWANIHEELEHSGLLDAELRILLSKIAEVNALSDKHIEEAKTRFLASLRQQGQPVQSQQAGLENTESGEPANDLESSLPA